MAGPLIPRWLPDHHPFYVSPATADRIRRGFKPNRIFLNIPYASRYSNLEVAVLSTATAYDLPAQLPDLVGVAEDEFSVRFSEGGR